MSFERSSPIVYLMGAGPGDPSLLTVRGADLLARAAAVVHDPDVEPALLRGVPEGARRLECTPGEPEREAALLAELAREHGFVIRLVAGDPFLSPPVVEVAVRLGEAGIRFEVVPGLSLELAAPAAAGIPLLHAGNPGGVHILDATSLERARGAGSPAAFVVRTEVGDVSRVLEAFGRAGVEGESPVVAVEAGATPRQRVVTGTRALLGYSPGRSATSVVLIVGGGAAPRESLAWMERRPLFGMRVVVTRARAQASGFAARLEELGAEVVQFPTIRIEDPPDPDPLRRAAAAADGFDWIVFTSVNGVARFWEALREGGQDTRSLAGVSLCAIGPATAAAIEMEGARADLVPDRYVGEAVVEALTAETRLDGSRILLARAEEARSLVPDALREAGAEVVEVAAYRTVAEAAASDALRRLLDAGDIDVLTFTASSTVRNYVESMGTDIGSAKVASIGPITSATARDLGLPVHVEAVEHTAEGLLAALSRLSTPERG